MAIKLKNKEEVFGFVSGAHSGTAWIKIKSIVTQEEYDAGSKTAEYIKKYSIDPLGYYHEVKNEGRKGRVGTIPQERKKRGSQGR